MQDAGKIRRFDIWIVTDGKHDRHIALEESRAISYAKRYNSHVRRRTLRVRVEHKTATVDQ